MKNIYFLVILLVLLPVSHVNCQTGTGVRDKYALLTMPYNKRPLALYKGQFQFNAGYKFAVRGSSYDLNGDIIRLKDNGTASVMHYYFAEIKYGITDFLEVSVASDYLMRGIRSETSEYWSLTELITVNNLTETKGMGDILLSATGRLPFEFKMIDFSLKGGLFLPTAKYEPGKPTHSVTDFISETVYTINYHFNNTNGYGVPVSLLSAAAKFTYNQFTLETDYSFSFPVKEGTNIRWDHTFEYNNFYYTKQSYQYLVNQTNLLNISVHYQAAGWFDLNLNGMLLNSGKGWTDYWGVKYKNPDQNLFSLEPGFEIKVSPALTIYQVVSVPLSGKNMDAHFFLFTTLSVNMFPFLKQ